MTTHPLPVGKYDRIPDDERISWVCPDGCSEQLWAHELYDGCPPSGPVFHSCCGADMDLDVAQLCAYRRCTEWFCGGCGRFTGSSAGPVGCPCSDGSRRAFLRRDPAQRPKRPIPGGARHHRRYRARQGARRGR